MQAFIEDVVSQAKAKNPDQKMLHPGFLCGGRQGPNENPFDNLCSTGKT